MGPHGVGQPDRSLRVRPRGRQVHDRAAIRQDHQYRLAVLLPRRHALTRLCRDQSWHRGLHQGLLRRAGDLQHPGQRHRAGILQDGDHRGDPGRSRRRSPYRRAHPRGSLGRDRRPDGSHRLPGQPGLGLRQRPRPGRRRRLSRPLTSELTRSADPAMVPSRSSLNRRSIVEAMTELLGPGAVETGDEQLKAASVDRFRKYTAVHGIYDGPIPAAIVYPSSTADVAAILRFAEGNLVNVVPRTGQTATEGGLETVVEDSLVVDGSRMNAILSIDPVDMMATTQCGVGLQQLEDTLRAQGLTTGHSPQSKPLAQMGGLVATRSIGQFSTLYGGIEDLVIGLEAVFPGGTVARVKNVPRRAAGPDIRHVIVGSEGALCFITEVTVKLFRYQPENNRYFGFLA